MSTPNGRSELVEIRLIGMPLDLQAKASEHTDGLRREFQMLVAQGQAEPDSVPGRLVALAAELDRRFKAFTDATRAEIEEARKGGAKTIDLSMHVPPSLGPAAVRFRKMLAEADAYCAAGEYLLTLATPPEVAAFTGWALGEMMAQIEGRAPVPWPDYAAGRGI